MKKLALVAILAATLSGAVSAAEFGINTGRNAGVDSNFVGMTLSKKVDGVFGVEGSVDRTTSGAVRVNRYSLLGTYELAKFNNVTVSAKGGVAYVNPGMGENGYAAVVGLGVSYPLTKTVSLVGDIQHQGGQNRISQYNGNIVSAGLKVSF
jgi:outer membrane autotransporter protein